jgi:hypothetical protein
MSSTDYFCGILCLLLNIRVKETEVVYSKWHVARANEAEGTGYHQTGEPHPAREVPAAAGIGIGQRKTLPRVGSIGHPSAAGPSGEADNPSTIYHQIQVAYNRVARSITGVKLRDRVLVPDLLERADIPSINGMVVNAVALENWSCRHSSDSGNGAKNFVGSLIFNMGKAVKTTRAATAGMAVIPLRGRDTFVCNGAKTWNSSEALRMAASKSAARLASKSLAARSPL